MHRFLTSWFSGLHLILFKVHYVCDKFLDCMTNRIHENRYITNHNYYLNCTSGWFELINVWRYQRGYQKAINRKKDRQYNGKNKTVPKSNRKIAQWSKIVTLNTNTWSLTFLTWYNHFNVKSGGVKLVL